MKDPLLDCSPLISAAASAKLRLVRLLVEGGAQVNGRNAKGETALLAACKALTEESTHGPDAVKLLTYLLRNKANPNVQDCSGRTALMYACMQRAGAEVASTLLSAGADPSMEDHSGASALVYAVNAQHQPTLEVLMAACRAKGCDIIIITTEVGVSGGPVTRRYLNVPPSLDSSPVSCMSPSDIVLKTGSPNSPEAENIFNFRGTDKWDDSRSRRQKTCELSPPTPPPRQRMFSEPWLALHNLACLNRAYEEGRRREKGLQEKSTERLRRCGENEGKADGGDDGDLVRVSQSLLSLTDVTSSQVTSSRLQKRISVEKTSPQSHLRRNTLPAVTVAPPPLHLPPLVDQSDSRQQVPGTRVCLSKSKSMAFLPRPPSSSTSRASLLPPLPLSSAVSSLVAPSPHPPASSSRRSLRRHSVQLYNSVDHCSF